MPDIDNFKGEEFVLAYDPIGLIRWCSIWS